MEKPWLKHYPQGVPSEIDPHEYRSLVHLLEEAFQKYAARRAFVCMDKCADLRASSTAVAPPGGVAAERAAWRRARAWR